MIATPSDIKVQNLGSIWYKPGSVAKLCKASWGTEETNFTIEFTYFADKNKDKNTKWKEAAKRMKKWKKDKKINLKHIKLTVRLDSQEPTHASVISL